MADDLKLCPFCGEADTRHFNNPDEFGRPSHGIQCCKCWVCGPERETPAEAIAAWNTRATDPRIEALEREKREAALDALAAAGQAQEAYEAQLRAEAKLAKAVEALRFYADENRYGLPSDGPWGLGSTDFGKIARATLAEIGGGKDD